MLGWKLCLKWFITVQLQWHYWQSLSKRYKITKERQKETETECVWDRQGEREIMLRRVTEKKIKKRERESTLQNKMTIFAAPLTVLKLFEEKKLSLGLNKLNSWKHDLIKTLKKKNWKTGGNYSTFTKFQSS